MNNRKKMPKVANMTSLDMTCFYFLDAVSKYSYTEQEECYHNGSIYNEYHTDYFDNKDENVLTTRNCGWSDRYDIDYILRSIPKNYYWTKTYNKKRNKHYLVLMSNQERQKFQVKIEKNISMYDLEQSLLRLLCMKKESEINAKK